MRTLLSLLLLLAVFTLPSCGIYGAYTKLVAAADKVDVSTEKADAALAKVELGLVSLGAAGEKLATHVTDFRGALQTADSNKDGRIAGMEWYELAMLILGLFGIGKYAQNAHSKIEDTDGKRRENAKTFYAEIDDLKQRLAGLRPKSV